MFGFLGAAFAKMWALPAAGTGSVSAGASSAGQSIGLLLALTKAS